MDEIDDVASSPFDARTPHDIRKLIESYPLAWVHAPGLKEASLLPLVGIHNECNELNELIGHFARSNPLNEAFSKDSHAEILFMGPQGYVSPSCAGRRDWAPTWNYVQARISANISVEDELTPAALELLINQVEKNNDRPWSAQELGERYQQLIPHIVGFRAQVRSVQVKFKLGQDETVKDLRHILSNLPETPLRHWMYDFNRDRIDLAENVRQR
ncbi:FMN-binding negative transcriptional regulator [Hyphococcus lacteus]|uniref:FMN-binding negative transcriptional regulator n=1 Tax=Hyphococcus lacteus TaxID=3143536 RepID=A0ABV3Z7H8_9PROT